jgi:membrane protein DedA with SNARE-associated domain
MLAWVRQQVAGAPGGAGGLWRRIRPLGLLLFVAVIIVAVLFRHHLPDPRNAGYPGIFFLNLIGSGGMVIPMPGMLSLCFGSSALHLSPLAAALVAAAAETLGETTGYLAGVSGQGLVERLRLRATLESWVRRHGGIAIFAFSMIPSPLFDVVGIAAGTLRYPPARFYLATFAGKCVKDITVAYACMYWFEFAVRWLAGG